MHKHWYSYEYEYVYSYGVNSNAITNTNTVIDNLLNTQDSASSNTGINTYITANTTMNNPNTTPLIILRRADSSSH